MNAFAQLAVFVLAVYGAAASIAVFKIGGWFFGVGRCEKKDCGHARHPYELRRFLGKIPKLGDLFYCPPCLAFWIGAAASRWALSPSRDLVRASGADPRVSLLVDGFLAVGAVWLLHVGTEYLAKDLEI